MPVCCNMSDNKLVLNIHIIFVMWWIMTVLMKKITELSGKKKHNTPQTGEVISWPDKRIHIFPNLSLATGRLSLKVDWWWWAFFFRERSLALLGRKAEGGLAWSGVLFCCTFRFLSYQWWFFLKQVALAASRIFLQLREKKNKSMLKLSLYLLF